MEENELAASVITVIDLSAKVASWCSEYLANVQNTKDDIGRLQGETHRLERTLKHLQTLCDSQNGANFRTSQQLRRGVEDCETYLTQLSAKLAPRAEQKVISRDGIQALKWPFDSNEVDAIIEKLSKCKDNISLNLDPKDSSGSPIIQESPLAYRYVALASNGSDIRLISLKQATTWTDPIKCEILHTNLEDVDYVALSYQWGSLANPQTIFVGERSFSCTFNLYSALQHLRRPSEDLILWVDAICIDQSNLEERGQQVGIMRQIYENASSVVVWLGPSSESSKRALELISELEQHSHDRDYIENRIAHPESLEDLYDLCRFCDLEYWNRVWVVQEVFSAKDIVVFCGSYSVPWQTLVGVQMLFEQYDGQLADIFRDHPTMRGYIRWRGPYALRLVYGDLLTDMPDLFEMVLKHVSKVASDPRDKIYAFVALSKHNETYSVDYSASVPDVYMNFVYQTVLQSKSLDVICALRRDGHDSEQSEFPSWVPNWGMKHGVPNSFLMAHIKALYKVGASGATSAHVNFDLDKRVMSVRGGIINTIHHLGKPCLMERLDDFEPAIMAILDWWTLLNTWKGTPEQCREAFVRTLCLNRIGDQHSSDHFNKARLLQWILGACSTLALKLQVDVILDESLYASTKLHDWPLNPMQEARAMGWVSLVSSNILHQRLCVISGDILALVPDTVEEGDKLCILLGCSLPVILRPIDDHYIFLGSAYVDGHMNGEAIEKIKLQEFHII